MVALEELAKLESWGPLLSGRFHKMRGNRGYPLVFRVILFRRVMNWHPGLTVLIGSLNVLQAYIYLSDNNN